MATSERKRPLGLVLLAVGGFVLLAYLFVKPPAAATGGEDFAAFYCASRSLSASNDPYRYDSLQPCETRFVRFDIPSGVVPAPLPPYALAMLRPLAALPFAQASFAWWFVLFLSAMVIVWAIAEWTSFPLWAIAPSITIAVLLQSLNSRALAPLPIALLCASAVAITNKRWNAAAVLMGFAFLEPHMAAPPAIATFVLVPQMRSRLLIVLSCIVVASIPAGIALNREYFTAVIPAQAASEAGFPGQYSLSFLSLALGMPESAALKVGGIQYLLFVVLGVVLSRSFRRTIPEGAVLVPMALAVTGGPYIHLSQVAAILPLAFVIAAQSRSAVAWIGIALLSVPWQSLLPIKIANIVAPRIANGELAESAWRMLAAQVHPSAFSWIAHAITYVGMGCVYLVMIMMLRRSHEGQRAVVRAAP